MDAIKDLDSCDEAIACQGEAIEQQIHSQVEEVRNAVDQAEKKMIEEVRIAISSRREQSLLFKNKKPMRN